MASLRTELRAAMVNLATGQCGDAAREVAESWAPHALAVLDACDVIEAERDEYRRELLALAASAGVDVEGLDVRTMGAMLRHRLVRRG